MPGSSSWMLYAPQGVKGFDDDESSTSLTGINVFISVLSSFIGLGKIQYERLAHTVLLNICQLFENSCREGHTYGCKLNHVTAPQHIPTQHDMLPQHLVCKYELNCEYCNITLARNKGP
jgi:hypothetical protein